MKSLNHPLSFYPKYLRHAYSWLRKGTKDIVPLFDFESEKKDHKLWEKETDA